MPEPVKSNGLAQTPPMGWNSWNKFRNQVSDKMIREMADAIVSSGMRDAGYVYVNIDDTWEGAHRDANGNITTNNKFPDMKALAAYVHSKGLKLGIYSSPGPETCAGYEGSYQHEEQDAKTWASWGIDYLKYDWCSASQVYDNTQATMAAAYAKMGNALLHSGRAIVFSLCQYGNHNVEDGCAYESVMETQMRPCAYRCRFNEQQNRQDNSRHQDRSAARLGDEVRILHVLALPCAAQRKRP